MSWENKDVIEFGNGYETWLVGRENNFSKEQFIKKCEYECEYELGFLNLKFDILKVKENLVRFYPNGFEEMEDRQPTYGFADKNKRGSFKVWTYKLP